MAITTKAGLIKSLSSLQWAADVTANDIIPRGYDLSTPQQMKGFIDDFRCQQADTLLRKIYKRITGFDSPVLVSDRPSTSPAVSTSDAPPDVMSTPPPASRPQTAAATWTPTAVPHDNIMSPDDLLVNKAVFGACCNIIEKFLKLHDANDEYLDDLSMYNNVNNNGNFGMNCGFSGYNSFTNNNGYPEALVTPLEWELIEKYDIFCCAEPLATVAPEAIDGFLQGDAEKEFVKVDIAFA